MGSAHYSDEIIREYQREAMEDVLDRCDQCGALFDSCATDRDPSLPGNLCDHECAAACAEPRVKRMITRLPRGNRIRIVVKMKAFEPRHVKVMYFHERTRKELTPAEIGEMFTDLRNATHLAAALSSLFKAFEVG